MDTPSLYEIFLDNPKVCIDNRLAEPKSIFFAIKGDRFDGNDFAEKALEQCAYAVVDNPDVVKDDRYILVEDALQKLQSLAKYHRKRLGLPVIAITGTNGKTTTKELIAKVLNKKYKVAYTQGNLNNHIGVPLTLLSFTKEDEFGVVEMGANHIGEISELCRISAPDFGLITNVGKAHLEGFGSFEGVVKAKSELYQYLYNNDGVAFVNYDNEYLEDMKPPHSVVYYGTKGFTHCQGYLESNGIFFSVKWITTNDDENHDFSTITESRIIKTNLFGEYNFENILAAICVGNHFHVSDLDIKKAIEEYKPTNKRSQIIDTDNNKVIVDSYNANPTSMQVAIDNFGKAKIDNKILILGDMFELGTAANREHGVILSQVKGYDFEKIILIGEVFNNYKDTDGILFFIDIFEFIEFIKKNPIKDKVVFVKGSNGMNLNEVLEYL
jgi:UDP-N-acetylmuramoyl-tripeptide--D-alanyl-D-alanine ligase